MRLAVSCLVLALAAPVAAQATRADLARARTFYNQRQYDQAIEAAIAARQTPETADSAAIVMARAHLERYRERADPADLGAARIALGHVRSAALDDRDQVELLLALGQSLFLEDDFGAAAEMFESGLLRSASAGSDLYESMLEWWGSAVERQSAGLSRDDRVAVFRRFVDRASEELRRYPTSPAASYWVVVAWRGAGDANRAWDAAVAGWVRARLHGERAPAVRADLDQLVVKGIIPDRVRHLELSERAAAESQLKAEWELVKEKWK